MNYSFRKLLWLVLFLACWSQAEAQLPNEKFGKPSSMEWDFVGWGNAVNADAIILCKTMKVSYQLSDQVFNYNQAGNEINLDNILEFSPNQEELLSPSSPRINDRSHDNCKTVLNAWKENR